MNSNETPVTPATPAASADAQSVAIAIISLRAQLQATLIIMIMISGALNLYLLRQWLNARKDLAAVEPQVSQMVGEYQRMTVPLVSKFLSQLTDFSKVHPDFQPILARYRIQAVTNETAAAKAQPAKPAAQPVKPATQPAKPAAPTAPAAAPKK